MAKKKRRAKKPKMDVEEEEPEIMSENEKRDVEYIFLALFGASIVFLLIYLVGFIGILLK
ncbi:hypothetical protein [Methanobacterium sp.]|uniref:hypothetical protein n=1 Tax=Methanobacterium sp. TaxID=2164 RepID=UPI003C7474A0